MVLFLMIKRATSKLKQYGRRSLRQLAKPVRGVTLIELALGMAILSLLSIAVSNMMLAATASQLNAQAMVTEETMAMSIVDRLRYDLRLATVASLSVTGGGSTLSFNTWNPSGGAMQAVTYTFTGTTLTRTVAGQPTYDFASGSFPAMRIVTQATAGRPTTGFSVAANVPTGSPGMVCNRVVLHNLFVVDNTPVNTLVDGAFGGKSQFRVDEVAFDVVSGTLFE
jgi:Tfp pilus assembly protein FimT